MTTTIDVSAITISETFDYGHIQDRDSRNWAMAAAGTIRSNTGDVVTKVIENGRLLQSAKERLPHGLYVPWVEQQCELRPQHAQKLIKAAEWSNAAHVRHLDRVTDVGILFLLSADSTSDDVREWFMERAAAGDAPTRAEVTERKRQASGKPPAPRPIELQALALWRKDQLSDVEAALALARSITTVTEAQVLVEIGLRELPRGKVLNGCAADFHRRPDGISWDRIPHAGRADVEPVPDPVPVAEDLTLTTGAEVLSREAAAERLGMTLGAFRQYMAPSRGNNGELIRNGWRVTRAGRGLYNVEAAP
jgi:hypothetical protein